MRNISIMKLFVLITILTLPLAAIAADHVDLVKQGNDSFHAKDFKSALKYYHEAEIELPESPELEYNMAGALYSQGGYEEAAERFEKALNTEDVVQTGRAHFNLGNTHFRIGDYQKAIEQYQEVLKINPDDMDAKFNLELSRKMLKEQMEQQQSDDQQQQQEQEQQQEQDKQEKPDEQQGQQDQEQQQPDQKQQPQPQPGDEQQMSREDAERILNALLDDEQEMQEKAKKKRIRGNYRGKDW